MKFYATINPDYKSKKHPDGLDVKGYIEIEAPSMQDARNRAWDVMRGAVQSIFKPTNFNTEKYPSGCLFKV